MPRLVLFVIVGVQFISACGEKELIPVPLSEQIIGVWEIVTIDGKTFEEFFAEELGDEEDIEANATKIEFVFVENNTVFLDIGMEFVFTIDAVSITMSFDMVIKGTYTVSDSTLTTVWEDISVTLEPEDLWSSAGVTAQDLTKSVNNELGLEIEHAEAVLDGDILTVTADDGETTVLKRVNPN